MRINLDLEGPSDAISATMTTLKAWCRLRNLGVQFHTTGEALRKVGGVVRREINLVVLLTDRDRQTEFFELTKRACSLAGTEFTMTQTYTDKIVDLHASSYALRNNSIWPILPTDRSAKIASDLG